MNSSIKIPIPSFLMALILALACMILLLPKAQAVTPAPDGGYPGGNTAEGQSALFSLTIGTYNTAVGLYSLKSNTGGRFNTGVGAGTLLLNTADENTAIGVDALYYNTTAPYNTASGASALFRNTTGDHNTANGYQALFSNTAGEQNTATGFQALMNNTLASGNTAVGAAALANDTTGEYNIALAFRAGQGVTTAHNVICIGLVGNNVDNSCYIENIFGATSSAGTAVLVNSNGRLGTMTSSRRFKEQIKPMEDASETLFLLKPVRFRYKKGIDPEGLECKRQFGLVAEDVEKINPDLVVRDKEGKPYSVRYDQVNAMLLNEFLKEHRKVERQGHKIQEQDATIVRLKSGIETLVATVKEQAAQIQKVSVQLEAGKPALQLVQKNQ